MPRRYELNLTKKRLSNESLSNIYKILFFKKVSNYRAHAAKFCEVIEDAVGCTPELPSGLSEAMLRQKSSQRMSAQEKDFADFLYNL